MICLEPISNPKTPSKTVPIIALNILTRVIFVLRACWGYTKNSAYIRAQYYSIRTFVLRDDSYVCLKTWFSRSSVKVQDLEDFEYYLKHLEYTACDSDFRQSVYKTVSDTALNSFTNHCVIIARCNTLLCIWIFNRRIKHCMTVQNIYWQRQIYCAAYQP